MKDNELLIDIQVEPTLCKLAVKSIVSELVNIGYEHRIVERERERISVLLKSDAIIEIDVSTFGSLDSNGKQWLIIYGRPESKVSHDVNNSISKIRKQNPSMFLSLQD